MFTGIVENLGKVVKIVQEEKNFHFFVESDFTSELKIDQSVAHNGVCLTVVSLQDTVYQVTAIAETLEKTHLKNWKVGEIINLERGMRLGDRLDGHIVQGHVDQIGICESIENQQGSTVFTFSYDTSKGNMTIEKGSITINGVSLTVINSQKGKFSVAIIPYTMEHTNFKFLQKGSLVNLEFDVVGKYILGKINQDYSGKTCE